MAPGFASAHVLLLSIAKLCQRRGDATVVANFARLNREWRRRRGVCEGGGGCAARGRPLYEWRDRVGALSVQSGLAGRAGSDRPRYAALAAQDWILGSGPVSCGAGPAGGKAPPGGMVARGILGAGY